MEIAGERGEFLLLEYADGDKLLLCPCMRSDRISRYTGAPPEIRAVCTPSLGSDQWQKARRKAAQRIVDDLLDGLCLSGGLRRGKPR